MKCYVLRTRFLTQEMSRCGHVSGRWRMRWGYPTAPVARLPGLSLTVSGASEPAPIGSLTPCSTDPRNPQAWPYAAHGHCAGMAAVCASPQKLRRQDSGLSPATGLGTLEQLHDSRERHPGASVELGWSAAPWHCGTSGTLASAGASMGYRLEICPAGEGRVRQPASRPLWKWTWKLPIREEDMEPPSEEECPEGCGLSYPGPRKEQRGEG